MCAIYGQKLSLAKTEKRKARAGKTEEGKTVCNCSGVDGLMDTGECLSIYALPQSSPIFHQLLCHLPFCHLPGPRHLPFTPSHYPVPDPTTVVDQAWESLHGQEQSEREGRGTRLCSSDQRVS